MPRPTVLEPFLLHTLFRGGTLVILPPSCVCCSSTSGEKGGRPGNAGRWLTNPGQLLKAARRLPGTESTW